MPLNLIILFLSRDQDLTTYIHSIIFRLIEYHNLDVFVMYILDTFPYKITNYIYGGKYLRHEKNRKTRNIYLNFSCFHYRLDL